MKKLFSIAFLLAAMAGWQAPAVACSSAEECSESNDDSGGPDSSCADESCG